MNHLQLLLLGPLILGQYKIDSLNWTVILFACNMVPAQTRKSIFRVEDNKNVPLNHLELIRDKSNSF